MTTTLTRAFTLALTLALTSQAARAEAGPNEALVAACKAGDLPGVERALAAGASVNVLDQDGNSPLASAFFWPEITKLLLERHADPKLGNTNPVFQAALFYSVESLKLLLDAGGDPNKPTLIDPKALFRTLIAKEQAKGPAANQAMIGAWTQAMSQLKPTQQFALPTVVYGSRCVPCVELLLAKGARVDLGLTIDGNLAHTFASSFNNTPEEWQKGLATYRGNLQSFGLRTPDWLGPVLPPDRVGTLDQMLTLLIGKGVDVNARNKGAAGLGPMTPLEVALNGGLGTKREVMLALVNHGADVKGAHPVYGPTILQAAQCGFPDVVKAMVDKGADVNQKGQVFTNGGKTALARTFTPLTTAALKNNTALVRYLVSAGAHSGGGVSGQIVTAKGCLADVTGQTAIFFAVEHDNLEMTQLVAEHETWDGHKLSFRPGRFSGCYGGGSYSPSSWAKLAGASAPLLGYLATKGL